MAISCRTCKRHLSTYALSILSIKGSKRVGLSARLSCHFLLSLDQLQVGRRAIDAPPISFFFFFFTAMPTQGLQSKRGDGSEQPNVVDKPGGAPQDGGGGAIAPKLARRSHFTW